LKNTGEVEDGEYDWMKLSHSKGGKAIEQLNEPNAAPNA
jgi:hypothetical protein